MKSVSFFFLIRVRKGNIRMYLSIQTRHEPDSTNRTGFSERTDHVVIIRGPMYVYLTCYIQFSGSIGGSKLVENKYDYCGEKCTKKKNLRRGDAAKLAHII